MASVWRTVVTIAHPSLGGHGTNTWHCQVDAGFTEADDLATQGAILASQFYGQLTGISPSGVHWDHDGQWLRIDDESLDVVQTEGFSLDSAGSANPLPPQDCLVVGWRTAQAGRSARGRTFVGPLGVNDLEDNGTPIEGARASLLTCATDLIDASGGEANSRFGVWSPKTTTFRAFTGAAVANRFSVLRSRRD